MKKKKDRQVSVSHKKSSILLVTFLIIFAFFILGSISVIQHNTRPKNFAQDITPILRCGSPCSYNAQCPHQLFCYNGFCRNPQCKNMEDCTCIITPTPNPYAPTPTRRPTMIAQNPVTPTPRSPTAIPTRSPTPSVIVIISPRPTEDPNPTPTESPLFEIDKQVPRNKTILDRFFDFVANLFCRIFGC